jgi:hypothetical protein
LPQTKKLFPGLRGALVFLCPKEEERREKRDERRETRDERRETRDESRENERRETSERENKSAGDYISKLPGPK